METVQEIEDTLNTLSEKIIQNRHDIERLNEEISLVFSPRPSNMSTSDLVPTKLKIDRSIDLLAKIDETLINEENDIEVRAKINTFRKFLDVEEKSHEEINTESRVARNFHYLSIKLLLKEVYSRAQLPEIREKTPSKLNYFMTFIFAALLGIGASYVINYIYRQIFK